MVSVPLMKKCLGLNKKAPHEQLVYNAETGEVELAQADNVDVVSGAVRRRPGYAQVSSASCYSGWSNGDVCYYVTGTLLRKLNADGTYTGMRSGLTAGARMRFMHDPAQDRVYYMNGFECGVLYDNASWVWMGETPKEKDLQAVRHDISLEPPVGHLLAIAGGRVLIAVGTKIYYSMQMAYRWFRLSSDWREIGSRLRAVIPVKDGIWVAADKGLYWLEGFDPGKWSRYRISDSVFLEGTEVRLPGREYFIGLTQRALIALGNSGEMKPIAEDKFEVGSAYNFGSSVVFNSKIIFTYW